MTRNTKLNKLTEHVAATCHCVEISACSRSSMNLFSEEQLYHKVTSLQFTTPAISLRCDITVTHDNSIDSSFVSVIKLCCLASRTELQ